MTGITKSNPEWVTNYNSEAAKNNNTKLQATRSKPNFAALTSDYFNGGSGDTATLYDVSKFIAKLYDDWVK